MRAPARAAIALMACLLLATVPACDGDPVTVPTTRGPFLYMILGQRIASPLGPDGPNQYALLLTIGGPTEPVFFRDAERFEMRRSDDGAPFAWRSLEQQGTLGDLTGGVRLIYPSHHLPDAPEAGALGADSLLAGGGYEITIETEGVVITGAVRLPGEIDIRLSDDGRSVAWDPVEGAAGYRVIDDRPAYITDTHYFPADDQSRRLLRVQALEENAWRYFTDERMTRSGIDAGRGVFGGMTSDTLTWP